MFIFIYVFACMCRAHGGQKRVSNSLNLELQVVVSHLVWVLTAVQIAKNK